MKQIIDLAKQKKAQEHLQSLKDKLEQQKQEIMKQTQQEDINYKLNKMADNSKQSTSNVKSSGGKFKKSDKIEQIVKDSELDLNKDLLRVSSDIDLKFRHYSENLKVIHEKSVEESNFDINKTNNKTPDLLADSSPVNRA